MISSPQYQLFLTPTAQNMLDEIKDRRIRQKIAEKIDGLAYEPEKQGKPLTAELSAFRSVRAVGQRYRIIYKVERNKIIVIIVAVGIRKEKDHHDIYQLAKKLIHLKLI